MKLFASLFALTALLSATVSAIPTDKPQITHKGGDEYVVLLDNTQENRATIHDILHRLELTPEHEDVTQIFNNTAFTGFVARMSEHCVELLGQMTEVSSMDRDLEVTSFGTARLNAPWGLERISSAQAIKGNPSELEYTYAYHDDKLGRGVDIYILDTGIKTNHDAFNGRARMGFSVTGSMDDGDGHGTHVAGTAAGIVVGVSSQANLIGVKVLKDDGSGTTSDTIRGIDWAIQNHETRKGDSDYMGSILSLSLGLRVRNKVLEGAILAALNVGVHVSLAAGNLGQNACSYSPAAIAGAGGPAIAIGSVGPDGVISDFSNRGACVDVYAPGESIISSWIGQETNLIHMLDGTSMACPHVTGLMAYYMVQYPALRSNPAGMKSFLTQTARTGFVTGQTFDDDAKLLASNGVDGGPIATLRQGNVRVKRRDNTVLGRTRRSLDIARRWVFGSGSSPVSVNKRDGDEMVFELVSEESPLRF